jgi:drug/metabolite transporter (DMT)-like permease
MGARPAIPLGWKIGAALLALYLLWGSTFLAIRLAVETIPPMAAAAFRWIPAGLVAYAVARPSGGSSWKAWIRSAGLAILLVVASNGGVTWAETRVPSGLAALAVASVSPWLVVLEALRPGGRWPTRTASHGVIAGVLGVARLADPRSSHVDPLGFAVLLIASFAFALGSTLSRLAPEPGPPLAPVARQMIAGGVILVAVSWLAGERPDPAAISATSVAAVAWLAVMGSLAGFTIYAWLLRVATPALAGPYSSVNPVVALLLGALVAHEQITTRNAIGAALVITGVTLVTIGQLETSPIRRVMDWWTGGGDDADARGPRGLVARSRATAAKAR